MSVTDIYRKFRKYILQGVRYLTHYTTKRAYIHKKIPINKIISYDYFKVSRTELKEWKPKLLVDVYEYLPKGTILQCNE